ncbi:hypothetical protein NPD5_125 [Clostridium sporogenes]|uniref:Fimbrial assembly protein n=1 Tax=Clostridium sporogenes TaxID=1509 RepID=A0A1L3NDG2_CLOSG|nr:hypothetical protein [Clostridium sporogenes]APH14156.1 hypothetical protein NPD5_125 [Clostridium sporogenes]
MKINFIPESYIEIGHKKSIKNHIVLIIILLTINIIFFNKVLWNMKRMDVINEEIHSLNLKKQRKNTNNHKIDKNYNLFINLWENTNEGIIVDSFNIKEGRANLEGRCLDLNDYYSLLNLLEKDKKINIKNLYVPEKEEDFYKFKFILE